MKAARSRHPQHPVTAARRLAPMLLALLLPACAKGDARPLAAAPPGTLPAEGAAPGDASAASRTGDGVDASADAGASGAAAAASAWPPALRAWSEKARTELGVPTLAAADAAALPDDILIVDVREVREVAVSGLPGAMALTSAPTRAEFVRHAAGETVLVYCTVGWRSAQYTQQLVAAGVKAFNLDGGLCAWAAAGRPLVDPQGVATKRLHAYSKDFADCVPQGFEAVTE